MKRRSVIFSTFLALSLLALIVINGCYRKKVDYVGPEYISAPANFSVLSFNVDAGPDFSLANCTTTATLSDRVTWTITYRGLTSGAVRTYTGVSDYIDASNGGSWNGGHEGIHFFRTGEDVEVTISFLRTDYTVKDTINIIQAKNYTSGNPNLIPISAHNSFETVGVFPAQFSFADTLPGTPTQDAYAARRLEGTSTIPRAVHGTYYFQISGKSSQADGFFVGGVQHRQAGFYFPSWTDPGQIYFNLYVYGKGNANTKLNLEFHEADLSNDGTKPRRECGPPNSTGGTQIPVGQHDPCTDDAWVYQLPLDFTGWKLVSVKMSNFTRSVSLNNGGSGNNIMEPNRVHRIQMGVVSAPTAFQYADASFDFGVITYGGPFDPTK